VTTFIVLGPASTKGSTVSFIGATGRVVTKADNQGLASWTQAVGWAARAAGVRCAPRDVAIQIVAMFQFVRPESRKHRVTPTVKPDIDKLTRALLDALTGVGYVDDAQVVKLLVEKVYGVDARTWVQVEQL